MNMSANLGVKQQEKELLFLLQIVSTSFLIEQEQNEKKKAKYKIDQTSNNLQQETSTES